MTATYEPELLKAYKEDLNQASNFEKFLLSHKKAIKDWPKLEEELFDDSITYFCLFSQQLCKSKDNFTTSEMHFLSKYFNILNYFKENSLDDQYESLIYNITLSTGKNIDFLKEAVAEINEASAVERKIQEVKRIRLEEQLALQKREEEERLKRQQMELEELEKNKKEGQEGMVRPQKKADAEKFEQSRKEIAEKERIRLEKKRDAERLRRQKLKEAQKKKEDEEAKKVKQLKLLEEKKKNEMELKAKAQKMEEEKTKAQKMEEEKASAKAKAKQAEQKPVASIQSQANKGAKLPVDAKNPLTQNLAQSKDVAKKVVKPPEESKAAKPSGKGKASKILDDDEYFKEDMWGNKKTKTDNVAQPSQKVPQPNLSQAANPATSKPKDVVIKPPENSAMNPKAGTQTSAPQNTGPSRQPSSQPQNPQAGQNPRSKMNIYVSNEFKDEKKSLEFNFVHINNNLLKNVEKYFEKPQTMCCKCIDPLGCKDITSCPCAKKNMTINGVSHPYEVKIVDGQPRKYIRDNIDNNFHIFECGKECSCQKDLCNSTMLGNPKFYELSLFDFVVKRYEKVGTKIPGKTPTRVRMWGLMTRKPIKKGAFVIEYVGELITKSEGDRRGQTYDMRGENYLFDLNKYVEIKEDKEKERMGKCVIEVDGHKDERPLSFKKQIQNDFPLVIDAYGYGNLSRFINHSCEPNLQSIAVHVGNCDILLPRIGLFSKRDIMPGEELTIDYECSPVTVDRKLECLCGSQKCRGYLYGPETKDAHKY